MRELQELLYRAIRELAYCREAPILELVRSSNGDAIIEEGIKLLGIKDLSEDSLPERIIE